jgi:hypothetical protein
MNQRLATSQSDLGNALADKGGGNRHQLVRVHNLAAGQKGHLLVHAVDATEVAAIGDRQPQIGDAAAMAIHQSRRWQTHTASAAASFSIRTGTCL